MKACYLCDLFHRKHAVILESKSFFSTFDTCPVSPGHILLITKRHIDDFSKLTNKEFREIQDAVKKIILLVENIDLREVYKKIIQDQESDQSVWFCKQALKHKRINTKPDGYNHGFNDGKAAGRTVDHFHWHIIPRYKGDIKNTVGGVRFVIPNMGDYHKKRK